MPEKSIIVNDYKVISHIAFKHADGNFRYLSCFIDLRNRLMFYSGQYDLVELAEMYDIEMYAWRYNRDLIVLHSLSTLLTQRDIVTAHQVFWFLYKLVAYIAASPNPPQEV